MALAAASANVAHSSHHVEAEAGPALEVAANTPLSEAVRDTEATSATSPFSLPSSSETTTDNLEEEEALLPLDRGHHEPMDHLVARVAANGPMTRKKMDEEAIAGTVVGSILGFALLVCCVYPFIVHRLKKNKRANRLHYDPEVGNFRGEPPISVRRLSSSDSFKRNETANDGSPKDRDRNSHDAYGQPIPAGQGQGQHQQHQQPGTQSYVSGTLDPNIAIEPAASRDPGYAYYPNPFPLTHAETYTEDGGAPQPYVLKGTNEDYYSPHIPSEAFGMYATPETRPEIPRPARTVSRGSSLRYNVKQIFRRKSTQDQPLSPHASADYTHDQTTGIPHLDGATPMQQFFPHRETNESPTEVSPTHTELPFSPRARGQPFDDAPGAISRNPEASGSQASYSGERGFASPPYQPAPGTVNPMDIMPASTQSEMCHRTDYQLYTGYESSPNVSYPIEQSQAEGAPVQLSHDHSPYLHHPPPSIPPPPPPSQPEQANPSSSSNAPPKKEQSKEGESSQQSDISSQTRMVPIPLPKRPSVPVNPSELSTPAQGTTSTTTQSTPSTHGDSPSPESLNSSDYCQSASPHALGIPSPRGGVYCCDEPGCNQVFDQPHKLK